MDHCAHCDGRAGPCTCRAQCPRKNQSKCTVPWDRLKADLTRHLADSVEDASTRGRPRTCATCGLRCENEVESAQHALETGHTGFRCSRRSNPDDPRERLPMRCTTCRAEFANGDEAQEHTNETGHGQFRGIDHQPGLHCDHCRGFRAPCGCREGCRRPAAAMCIPRDEDVDLNRAILASLADQQAPVGFAAGSSVDRRAPADFGPAAGPVGGGPRPSAVAAASTAQAAPAAPGATAAPASVPPPGPAAQGLPTASAAPAAAATGAPPPPAPPPQAAPPAAAAAPAAAPRPAAAPSLNDPAALSARVIRLTDVDLEVCQDFAPITGVMRAARLDVMEAAIHTGVPDMDAFGYVASDAGTRLAESSPHGLDKAEAGTLYLYTMESELYRSMNEILRQRGRPRLKPFFPLLRLLLEAKAKLPVCPADTTVWRGVKMDLRGKFPKGLQFYWWAFTSTTASLEVLHDPTFLGKEGRRTIFSIKTRTGRDISYYSCHQGKDAEILIFPGARFKVVDCADFGELVMVDLEEVEVKVDLVR